VFSSFTRSLIIPPWRTFHPFRVHALRWRLHGEASFLSQAHVHWLPPIRHGGLAAHIAGESKRKNGVNIGYSPRKQQVWPRNTQDICDSKKSSSYSAQPSRFKTPSPRKTYGSIQKHGYFRNSLALSSAARRSIFGRAFKLISASLDALSHFVDRLRHSG
jgi:hypothetical protein